MSSFFKDLTERVIATFAFAFLSVFTFTDLGTGKEAAVAGGAAALSVLKGWLASVVGADNHAGLTK